ncbi:DUF421 domain-containing protein [Micromonospora sp. KC723]|uniref:DUF421 domain-containing protein n=1 Tax=Micromonospora sp. KC723 TaxID=2530381 RepID=UPI0010503D07|nr:YetF domain-containing protein [Micromonospora sp. KC723]TDB76195.1 DUF421 domain-containing protein [Micromonospora sp. KC723]
MLHDLLLVQIPLAEKVLRSVAVYLFLVVALRLGGKRELAQLNTFDLVVLLLLSNTVQNAVIGADNSLLGGLLGAAVLLGVNYVVVRLGFRHPGLARVMEGTPTVLVQDGRTVDANLRRYLISKEELAAAVRRQGVRGIEQVDTAVLEANGTLTVEQPDRTEEVLRRLDRIEALLDPDRSRHH